MISFIILASPIGEFGESLQDIIVADIIGSIGLIIVLWSLGLKQTAET